MKKNLIHQPLFRVLVPPIYGTMMYLLILLLNNSLGQLGDTVFTIEMLVCVALAFLISESLRLVILLFQKKAGEDLLKTTTIGALVLTNLLVGAALVFLAAYCYFRFSEGMSYFSLFKATLFKMVVVYGISGLLFTLFFLSTHFLSEKNETELRKEDLKRQNLEHQLEIFNNEINPDLLFQSLETLISLVHYNQDKAEDFVDRLAVVYRYILENRKRELVVVKEELAAAKNLMYLFQERYPEMLQFKLLNKEQNAEKLMVPSALPTMLDCIVNNSIINTHRPLHVTIDAAGEEGYLVIQYTDNQRLSQNKFIKKRCKRVHEAFAFFSDRPVIEIKAYGNGFVKLPLLDLNDRI
ncbi:MULTISPECIES: histidine kinase [Roseivirga]|uniref:histidine kinase n=1 Tax=Roseivirga TaxID=290180 RepID=UPI00257F8034|nr:MULTISPECIES: sensor histidine kinase [Roseivirga]|tara:strand:- start:59596 stop:60654 length:1059 start_codon:yes stop_codon:yes gene_type:complete